MAPARELNESKFVEVASGQAAAAEIRREIVVDRPRQ